MVRKRSRVQIPIVAPKWIFPRPSRPHGWLFRCRHAKKPPEWATKLLFCPKWSDFLRSLEPISEVMAEPYRLSPPTPARASPRSPHQKNPLPYFLRFPPPNFFFSCKGCFWWFDCHFHGRGVGASPRRHSRPCFARIS